MLHAPAGVSRRVRLDKHNDSWTNQVTPLTLSHHGPNILATKFKA